MDIHSHNNGNIHRDLIAYDPVPFVMQTVGHTEFLNNTQNATFVNKKTTIRAFSCCLHFRIDTFPLTFQHFSIFQYFSEFYFINLTNTLQFKKSNFISKIFIHFKLVSTYSTECVLFCQNEWSCKDESYTNGTLWPCAASFGAPCKFGTMMSYRTPGQCSRKWQKIDCILLIPWVVETFLHI